MDSTPPREVVQNFVQVLGFDGQVADVYLALCSGGPATAVQLAATTGISRPQVYRRLADLESCTLAAQDSLQHGSLFYALPFSNAAAALTQRQARLQAAQASLGMVDATVRGLRDSTATAANMQQFYGHGGIAEALWQLATAVRSGDTIKILQTTQGYPQLSRRFGQLVYDRLMQSGASLSGLSNSGKYAEIWPVAADQWRELDTSLQLITQDTIIHGQSILLLDHTPGAAYALRIDHPLVHGLMVRQFDLLWQITEPLHDI